MRYFRLVCCLVMAIVIFSGCRKKSEQPLDVGNRPEKTVQATSGITDGIHSEITKPKNEQAYFENQTILAIKDKDMFAKNLQTANSGTSFEKEAFLAQAFGMGLDFLSLENAQAVIEMIRSMDDYGMPVLNAYRADAEKRSGHENDMNPWLDKALKSEDPQALQVLEDQFDTYLMKKEVFGKIEAIHEKQEQVQNTRRARMTGRVEKAILSGDEALKKLVSKADAQQKEDLVAAARELFSFPEQDAIDESLEDMDALTMERNIAGLKLLKYLADAGNTEAMGSIVARLKVMLLQSEDMSNPYSQIAHALFFAKQSEPFETIMNYGIESGNPETCELLREIGLERESAYMAFEAERQCLRKYYQKDGQIYLLNRCKNIDQRMTEFAAYSEETGIRETGGGKILNDSELKSMAELIQECYGVAFLSGFLFASPVYLAASDDTNTSGASLNLKSVPMTLSDLFLGKRKNSEQDAWYKYQNQNDETGRAFLIVAAEYGDPIAQKTLALNYVNGQDGFDKNTDLSCYWAKRLKANALCLEFCHKNNVHNAYCTQFCTVDDFLCP